jgi:hypothetical protein
MMSRSDYYKLNDLYIAVHNKKEENIKVGNPMAISMPCVVIEIQNSRVFYLASMTHHTSCNITRNLQHGKNGTVEIMQLSLVFAKMLYPHISKIELQDTSGYHDHELGYNVNLSDKDFFFTGKTWYERHLLKINLIPQCKRDKIRVDELRQFLDSYPSNQDQKDLRARHINVSKRKTFLENLIHLKLKKGNPAVEYMFIFQRDFKIPTLHGITWIGSMNSMNPFDIPLDAQRMKRPREEDVKAMWGGKTHEEAQIRNNLQ